MDKRLVVLLLFAPLLMAAEIDINQTTCVRVEGIVGKYCYEDAPPIVGRCTSTRDLTGHRYHDCFAHEQEFLIVASWYNPALCDVAPTNCDGDPTTIAVGKLHDWMYGQIAACPLGWLEREIDTPCGQRTCLDHGGAIRPVWRLLYTRDGFVWVWAIMIDLLEHQAPACYMESWRISD